MPQVEHIGSSTRPAWLMPGIVLGSVVIGFVVIMSLAAGAYGFLEPENGTLSGKVAVVNQSGASGGRVIKFGVGSTPAPTPTPAPTTTPTPVPTPTSTPSGGKNCAAAPSACGYPDATNTGWQHTGVTLTRVNQDPYIISTAGAVVDSLDIHGCVEVLAKNVTIKRSKITCDNQPMVKNFEPDGKGGLTDVGAGLIMSDVEFDGTGNVDSAGVAFDDYTILRANFHDIGAAVKVGDNVDIEDSYVHNIASNSTSHNSGFPSDGGIGITLRHNTVMMNTQNGYPIALYNAESAGVVVQNVVVDNNLLAGGNYLMYCGTPGKISPNLRVTNNRFSKAIYSNGGFYGSTANCTGAAAWTNNFWDDTLGAVAP